MKKLLLGLGSLAAVATPVVAVISCGSDDKKDTKEVTTTDAQSVAAAKTALEAMEVTGVTTAIAEVTAATEFNEAVITALGGTTTFPDLKGVTVTYTTTAAQPGEEATVSLNLTKGKATDTATFTISVVSSTGAAHWSLNGQEVTFPTGTYYETGTANEYTSDETKANGYVAEVLPNAATLPTPSNAGETIKIDGTTYTSAAGTKTWDKTLPTSFWESNTTAGEFTTTITDAKDYKAAVSEVKPKIGTVEISSLAGGDAYDASNWTWTKGANATPATATTVNGVDVNLNGVQTYDAANWTYSGTAAASGGATTWNALYNGVDTTLTESTTGSVTNSTFGGADLGSNLPAGTDVTTKAAIIDALVNKTKITGAAATSGGTLLATITGLSAIATTLTFTTDLPTSINTDALKAQLYDELLSDSTVSFIAGSITDAPQPSNGTAPQAYTDDTTLFVSGEAATDATYTASYGGTPLTNYTQTVSTAPGANTPPTNFTPSTDYKAGTKGDVGNPNPTPTAIDLSNKNVGDKIKIDGTEYEVKTAIAFPNLPTGKVYATANAKEYVTNVTQADGYVAGAQPSPATIVTDGSVTTIKIDDDTYTWVDPSTQS